VAWTQQLFTLAEIEAAGQTLIAPMTSREDRELAVRITNNWRSAHAFPLNTLQVNLRRVAREFDPEATVAQRLKRLPSIVTKLERLDWLTLAEMQDLGGCRAVVDDVDMALAVAERYRNARLRHRLIQEDNYIAHPKRSGYRGIHLIYGYSSDKNPAYNGMKIEMQIRSRLQHAWATAVETVDMFTNQALKSSVGEQNWLRFFVLMSAVIALREESPRVPGSPHDIRELLDELRGLAGDLRVTQRLAAYGQALRFFEDPVIGGNFMLLELDAAAGQLRLRTYANPAAAAVAYDAIESAAEPSVDVVLVRAESADALRRAYPNYFADSTAFIAAVEDAIAR